MGKVRIKSFGDEELEKKESQAARKKAEAKRAHEELMKKTEGAVDAPEEKIESKTPTEENLAPQKASEETQAATTEAGPEESAEKPAKKKKEKFLKTKVRSANYKASLEKIDKTKTYSLKEALEILSSLKRAKFDETVELHINTTEQSVGATVTLPHGTGKEIKVEIADASDQKTFQDLLARIESGKLGFDVLIATPETMPSLAKVARVLGPKGLMPNPKSGTVTQEPKKKAEDFQKGQITFKTEAKSPIIHLSVGKISFGPEKLSENITTVFKKLPAEKITSVTLKSTMSPGIKVRI